MCRFDSIETNLELMNTIVMVLSQFSCNFDSNVKLSKLIEHLNTQVLHL
jgi:hypothetical protein